MKSYYFFLKIFSGCNDFGVIMFRCRKLSSDLLLIMIFIMPTNTFVLIPPLSTTFIHTLPGLPFVLFLPGYSLISTLFPAKSDIDGIKRTALSFGTSITVTPLIGLSLSYTLWGTRLLPILISLSVLTFFTYELAYLRRAILPEADAFEVLFRDMELSLKAEIRNKPESKLDKTLKILPILWVLLSVAIFINVIVTPKEGNTSLSSIFSGLQERPKTILQSMCSERMEL